MLVQYFFSVVRVLDCLGCHARARGILEYYTVLVPSVHGISDFRVSPESFFDLFG